MRTGKVPAMAPAFRTVPRPEGASAGWRAARRALRARAVTEVPRPEAEAAATLATLAEGSVVGVLFFGSMRTGASPDPWSAYDFFVVVTAYRPFYAALAAKGRVRRRPWLLAALNAVLPPNQISLRLPDGRGGELHAKCSVITLAHLRRETGERRRDHFTIGRLFQPAEVLFAVDDEARERLLDALASAAAATFHWGRPWLPARFDSELYLRTLLRASLSREVRPEPTGRRADALHEAQRDEQLPVYRALLFGLRADGVVRTIGEPGGEPTYALVEPVSGLERMRVGLYFRVSLARATLRWFKYALTFDDWLSYLVHKVERHTGQKVELTARERAWPIVFLWPRLVRYLRAKDDASSGGPGSAS